MKRASSVVNMNVPKAYRNANNLQRKDAQDVLNQLGFLIKWKGKPSVLDIGCGPGDVTIDFVLSRMPEDYEKLVGIDISEKMVDFARETYGKISPKVHFEVGDISGSWDQFSNYSEAFDHVTSFYCLNWVPNQR